MESPNKKHKCQIQNLPSEILEDILLLLPAESLMNLKIVCKSWFELINSKIFQTSHVNKWRNNISDTTLHAITTNSRLPTLVSFELIGDVPAEIRCYPLRFDQFFRRSNRRLSSPTPALTTTVLDCYEGLFLVRRSKHLFLCNPLTNSYLALHPKRVLSQLSENYAHWRIASDLSNGEYVIFCAVKMIQILVISSLRIDLNCQNGRKSAWREVWSSRLQPPSFPDIRFLSLLGFLESISMDGKVHWLFNFKDIDYDLQHGKALTGILTIDAATEESTITRCSAIPPYSFWTNYFKSDNKFYCMMESFSETALEIWRIDDVDDPTWVKQRVIEKDSGAVTFGYFSGILKQGNKLIMRSMYSRQVFIYNFTTKKWEFTHIHGHVEKPRRYSRQGWLSHHFSLLIWN